MPNLPPGTSAVWVYPRGTTTYWLLSLLPPHSIVLATTCEPSFEVSVIPVQASDDAGMSITEKIIVTEISLSD